MNTLYSLLTFAGVLLAIWIIFKILSLPLKLLWKLFVNALIGAVILIVKNILGSFIGISISITPITALIAGVFGVPGAVVLIVLKLLLII